MKFILCYLQSNYFCKIIWSRNMTIKEEHIILERLEKLETRIMQAEKNNTVDAALRPSIKNKTSRKIFQEKKLERK